MRGLVLTLSLAVLATPTLANCPSNEAIQGFVADWDKRALGKALQVSDIKDATCARVKLVEALRLKLGKVIGYKAGLTAKPTQERFNASAPVAGVLLEAMILKDGASVPADYGARPRATCFSS